MRRVGWARLAAVAAGASWMAWAGSAGASSGLDSPDSGVEQMGRGSAWVARADNPMAAFFNPAAMAFQATGVHLGAQMLFGEKCYTRTTINPATGEEVAVPPFGSDSPVPAPLLPGQAQLGDGSTLPSGTTCAKGAFPNPQLGAVFRITNSLAIGLAVVAPHSIGKAAWGPTPPSSWTGTVPAPVQGESIGFTNRAGALNTMPSPNRYMLATSDALIVNPTISIAYAPREDLAFGAGFVWGIATAHFENFAEAISTRFDANTKEYGDHAQNDVKASFKTKDLFIPGFILSALWSPTSNLDVAAWFKWQDALRGTGDVVMEAEYWNKQGRNDKVCESAGKPAGCNIQDTSKIADKTPAGALKLNLPMEAKLGLRFHLPRADQSQKPGWAGVEGRKVRDPISQDWFDAELDFTWANNSTVQDLELTFKPGIPLLTSGGPIGQVPQNANIPHKWKDVIGVRLGGDVVVIPNRLTLRTGGFFESKGQDDAYLALDFNLAWKAGVGGGATVRLGPVDVSVGYAHTFFGTIDNHGKGAVYGLSGDSAGPKPGDAPCADFPSTPKGTSCYRTWQTVNGGKLTSYLNEVGLSASARF